MSRPVCFGVALAVLLVAARSAAEPAAPAPEAPPAQFFHVPEAFHVTLKSGRGIDMPPSYIMPEPVFNLLDVEVKRLQAIETQLTAERDSLVASASDSGFGWGTVTLIVGALVAGAAGTWALR